jgi:hypothetical protein
MEKWCAYKKRNLLQKMDNALNSVTLSKEELKCASDEVLKQSTSGESNSRMFDIDAVAKPAVMQVMQCMTKNFPKNV